MKKIFKRGVTAVLAAGMAVGIAGCETKKESEIYEIKY